MEALFFYDGLRLIRKASDLAFFFQPVYAAIAGVLRLSFHRSVHNLCYVLEIVPEYCDLIPRVI